MIVKKYRENGKIFEKKEDKIKREYLEEFKANNELHNGSTTPPIENSTPMYYFISYQFPAYISNPMLF